MKRALLLAIAAGVLASGAARSSALPISAGAFSRAASSERPLERVTGSSRTVSASAQASPNAIAFAASAEPAVADADSFDTDATNAIAPDFTANNSDWRVFSAAGMVPGTNTPPNYFGLGKAGSAFGDTTWQSKSYATSSVEMQYSFVPSPGFETQVQAIFHDQSTHFFAVNLYDGSVVYWTQPGSGAPGDGTAGGSWRALHDTTYAPFTFYCAKALFTSSPADYVIRMKVWPCGDREPSYGSPLSIARTAHTFGATFTAGFTNNDQNNDTQIVDDFAQKNDGAGTLPLLSRKGPALHLRPLPGAHVRNSVYNPPPGTFPLFTSKANFFTRPFTAIPSPDPRSSAWIEANEDHGRLDLGNFNFPRTQAALARDYSFPIYYEKNNGPGYYVHCTVTYPCPVEGYIAHLTSRMYPENCNPADGPCTTGDRHLALIDTAHNQEVDLTNVTWPPRDNVLTVGVGGHNPLTGTGYARPTCGTISLQICQTEGLMRAVDLLNAISKNTVMPYALQIAVNCDDGAIEPFPSTGDSHCAAGPPQGARLYCALTDAQIDALSIPPMAKAILRTMDEQHYGAYITDTNGTPGSGSLELQTENDLTYEAPLERAIGTGPYATKIVDEAKSSAEHITVGGDATAYSFQVPVGGTTLASCLRVQKITTAVNHF